MIDQVKLGSSGARLVFDDETVRKYDVKRTGTRVRDQGIWLSGRPGVERLPDVQRIFADGYEMERLRQVPLEELVVERERWCVVIQDSLESIWIRHKNNKPLPLFMTDEYDCGGPFVPFRPWQHGRYVTKLLRQTSLLQHRHTMRRMSWTIKWRGLEPGLTHGDPILENLLFRSNTPVLIDPIPACGALPDLRASDVGRIIQSAVGYERIRYNLRHVVDRWDARGPHYAIADVLNYWMEEKFDLNEARAAVYFSIIHTARGVRSAPDDVKAELRLLVGELVREAALWMR